MRTGFLVAALCAAVTFAASTAQAAIKTQTVEYKQGDTALEGWLVYDDATHGKRPGVLVFPQWMGPSGHEKGVAEKLAKMGYVAFVADVYGKGVRPDTPQTAGAESGKYMKDRPLLLARAQAGLRPAAAVADGRHQQDRGHRLLLRRCPGARSGAQRRGPGRRRHLPRRAADADARECQEHQSACAGAARRGRPDRQRPGGRRLRERDDRRQCRRLAGGALWRRACTPSPTRCIRRAPNTAANTMPRPTSAPGRR